MREINTLILIRRVLPYVLYMLRNPKISKLEGVYKVQRQSSLKTLQIVGISHTVSMCRKCGLKKGVLI